MSTNAVEARLNPLLGRRLTRRRVLRGAAALGLGVPAMARLLCTPAALGAQESAGVRAQEDPVPPDAPRRSDVSLPLQLWGDPYRWLENPDDPEVIAYLEAENAYTAAMMAPLAGLQETLYAEIIGRFKQTDATIPTPWRGYLYYQRIEEGKDYEIVCRRLAHEGAPEQILLDLNAMAGDYIAMSAWRPSPNNRYLAYGIDQTGAEDYWLFVMDMASGQIVAELPPAYGYEWAQDGRALYYVHYDSEFGHEELARHTVGTDPATDDILYQEHDPNFSLAIYPAKDRTHLFLESSTFDTTEVRALRLGQPTADLMMIAPRADGVQHFLEHHGDEFLILTDDDAPNFKLMAAPVADPARANWREVIPRRDNVVIDPYGVEPFARHFLIYGREDGFPRLWVRDAASGATRPIEFEEAAYVVGATHHFSGGENWTFDTDRARIVYSSLVTPASVYEIDLATGDRTLLKRWELIGGHDPSRYVTERLFATAADGTRVPISLVSLREPPAGLPAGPRPLRLDGYGGYGFPMDPYFSASRLALLDRGVSYAIAHIRGGGELGEAWWEQGRLLQKKTCFSDFIACAEHLIAEGRTAPDRLAAYGASNGGLLMGVVANERPELFRVVVAEEPAADIVAALLLTPGGLANQDEFGDPADLEVFAYQRSYSPYQNVTAQDYPAMMVIGGLNDARTPYWLPAKWVAMLRDLKTDDNPLLLRTEMASGHFGPSGRDDAGRQAALMYAFVLQALGIAGVRPNHAAATILAPHAAKRSTELTRARPMSPHGQPLVPSLEGRRAPPRTVQARSAEWAFRVGGSGHPNAVLRLMSGPPRCWRS
jgi:oligopeptidase B